MFVGKETNQTPQSIQTMCSDLIGGHCRRVSAGQGSALGLWALRCRVETYMAAPARKIMTHATYIMLR